MSIVLLTGSTGFVGQAILRALVLNGESVICPDRKRPRSDREFVSGIDGDTDWFGLLAGVSCVIHSAARVHVVNETVADPLSEFRKVNVEGTLKLATQAAALGVKRFIFLSSIKVNGETTSAGSPFTSADAPAPLDAYGISKWEAEQGLNALARETDMDVVIIRPVLVYGPGVKANFLGMMNWLNKGFPLPLGALDNRRSLVGLDNLVDLIVLCVDHPAAANQVFLVSDDEDISTTELLERMAHALGKPARLLPVPSWVLQAGASLVGKREVARRLCESLQVDIGKTKSLLDWRPPVALDAALRITAKDFLERRRK
ncbi:UDP-glucose 4-epimerase family protein [Pseudomonas kuykendallii]|uniref:NAD-dependent dehydratase n=1 Tax=Pseudomonas kuykendallii TaxID=1007099 RepID=A0A2W5ESW9_9PSED|nr:SDR family oxidoreductase [Pseudomonas kuykendallii]PZP21962.1 MAG: NAD-dependent dehydratase [Pseudomonas kuykendallii]